MEVEFYLTLDAITYLPEDVYPEGREINIIYHLPLWRWRVIGK